MCDHGRAGEAAEGAAQSGRYIVAKLGQAFDVGLVHDGVFPAHTGPRLAAAAADGLVDHDDLRHAARVVAAVERQVLAWRAGAIGEVRLAPHQPSVQPLRIGVEQQLVSVEAMAAIGIVRAMHPIAVELPGRDVVEVAVPDVFGALRQFDPFQLAPALGVEQAELHLVSVGGEQGEVGAAPVPGRSETGVGSGGEAHSECPDHEIRIACDCLC